MTLRQHLADVCPWEHEVDIYEPVEMFELDPTDNPLILLWEYEDLETEESIDKAS